MADVITDNGEHDNVTTSSHTLVQLPEQPVASPFAATESYVQNEDITISPPPDNSTGEPSTLSGI